MRHALWLPVVVALIAVPPAHADGTKEASELYRQGSAAFERGEYQIAAVAFEAAFARAPQGAAAMGAALAWDEHGDAVRAANNYLRAVEAGGLEAAEQVKAVERQEALGKKLCRARLSGPSDGRVSVAGVPERALPFTVFLLPGEPAITATLADGTTTTRIVRCEAGASADLSFDKASDPVIPPKPPAVEPDTKASGPAPLAVLGIVGLSLGGAFAGATIGLGVHTLNLETAYEDSGFHDVGLYEDGTTFRTATNVSLTAAAGFAALGTVLLIVSLVQDDAPKTSSPGAFLRF